MPVRVSIHQVSIYLTTNPWPHYQITLVRYHVVEPIRDFNKLADQDTGSISIRYYEIQSSIDDPAMKMNELECDDIPTYRYLTNVQDEIFNRSTSSSLSYYQYLRGKLLSFCDIASHNLEALGYAVMLQVHAWPVMPESAYP